MRGLALCFTGDWFGRTFRRVFKFYWGLLRDLPDAFRSTAESLGFWGTAVALAVGVTLSPKLGGIVAGLSPWWGLTPLGLAFLYAALRVNYQRVEELRRHVREQATSDDVQRRIDRLAALRAMGVQLFAKPVGNQGGLILWKRELAHWREEVNAFLETDFTDAIRLRFANLGSLADVSIGGSLNPDHNHERIILDRQLHVLAEIVNEATQVIR